MKRFLLFIYPVYYPSGGWEDFHGSYDTEAEAVAVAKAEEAKNDDPWHVVDSTTGTVCTNFVCD